jgi:RIO kinase 1
MDTSKNLKYYNELDDEGRFDFTGVAPRKRSKPKTNQAPVAIQQFVQHQDDTRSTFKFTYQAARFEEGWLLDSLGFFYEQKWISDVLRKIKAGKEASVYLCRSGELVDTPYVAAKVYRPRMLRNLRNDHLYQEGRVILDDEGREVHDSHSLHAVITRAGYGEKIRHQSWMAYEYTTLQALFQAKADVPRPFEMGHNAILMSYIGDLATPAPALNEIRLCRDETMPLFQRVMENIDILLNNNLVHGDLSAYNILYWDGCISLIDFPQVVSPGINRNSYAIFTRDVIRVCEYFVDQGLRLNPHQIAANMWTSHGFHVRPDIHPGMLDANDPQDRKIWNLSK